MNEHDLNEFALVLALLGIHPEEIPTPEPEVNKEDEIIALLDTLLTENQNMTDLVMVSDSIIAIQERAIVDLNLEVIELNDELDEMTEEFVIQVTDASKLLLDGAQIIMGLQSENERLKISESDAQEAYASLQLQYVTLIDQFSDIAWDNFNYKEELQHSQSALAELQAKVDAYSDYATSTAQEMQAAQIEELKTELFDANTKIERLEREVDQAWQSSGYCE